MNLRVKRFVPTSLVVLEGDSFLKPVIKLQAGWTDKGKSKLTIGVYYDRKSAMFQVTVPTINNALLMISLWQYIVGPVLKFFTMQHIRHSLFVLHWILPEEAAKPTAGI